MLGERFRRQLVMDGHYSSALCFVATASDDVCVSELRKNLGKEAAALNEKELALLRNKRAKDRILRDCYTGLRRVYEQSGEDASDLTDAVLRARGITPSVFTVSSRDYQKLAGHLASEDGEARLWGSLEETEIPQLRRWFHQQGDLFELRKQKELDQSLLQICRKLCRPQGDDKEGRAAPARASLCIDEAMKVAETALIGKLDLELQRACSALATELLPRISIGQMEAAEQAPLTMEPKCAPKGAGGVHHGTFKATCRRLGSWKEDWNALLADPLNRSIATKWDLVLNRQLPEIVKNLKASQILELQAIQKRLQLPAVAAEEAGQLLRSGSLARFIRDRQMDTSRQIKDNVQVGMTAAYQRAAATSGTGMDIRQKEIVRSFVRKDANKLFKDVAGLLNAALSSLLADLKGVLQEHTQCALQVWKAALSRELAGEAEQARLQGLRESLCSTVAKIIKDATERVSVREDALERVSMAVVKAGASSSDVAGDRDRDVDMVSRDDQDDPEESDSMEEMTNGAAELPPVEVSLGPVSSLQPAGEAAWTARGPKAPPTEEELVQCISEPLQEQDLSAVTPRSVIAEMEDHLGSQASALAPQAPGIAELIACEIQRRAPDDGKHHEQDTLARDLGMILQQEGAPAAGEEEHRAQETQLSTLASAEGSQITQQVVSSASAQGGSPTRASEEDDAAQAAGSLQPAAGEEAEVVQHPKSSQRLAGDSLAVIAGEDYTKERQHASFGADDTQREGEQGQQAGIVAHDTQAQPPVGWLQAARRAFRRLSRG
eukprot:TRINITY_DN30198_c0_g2_i1.p1 TRINITY_DN30198_c0_g2~~TRINITY_DN30198_c0_g2_i1.p1  ORF type:complete len:779 (+),score=195.41 TRINITY_DN30198_c0_g2_i1:954-3290(+)